MTHVDTEALRAILENIHHPEMLDSHPWVSRFFVKEAVARRSELGRQNPGAQLVGALTDFFAKTVPSAPPRRGKRLDTRWGEFGLLAAQYFAPLQFGVSVPNSLRDAWGRIDHAILLYVFGRGADSLSQSEISAYKLVGDEPEVAPTSTLSDWHTKGMQKLAEALTARDQYLAKEQPRPRRRFLKAALLILLLALASFLTWGGFKARRVYNLSLLVWQEASQLRDQAADSPKIETVKAVGPALGTLRQDFATLKQEVEPFLWFGPWLGWVPVYGGDIASSPDLLALVDSLLASSDQTYQALVPILETYGSDSTSLNPVELIGLLNQAGPQLMEARASLDLAMAARTRLDPTRLSPRVRGLLDDVDRILALMDDGLVLAVEIPSIAGASSEGPKSYLLLVQNEDELRPTGGFITAAGTLLLRNGEIGSLDFKDTGDLDNWERPYPVAPWQLQQYMNSPVLIFRDSNWFTHYPTTVLYAEYLYSYVSDHSVDGVIAFDQHMLVKILQAIGPIEVKDAEYMIDSSNVLEYMRASKTLAAENRLEYNYDRKVFFIENLASAVLEKILSGEVAWEKLASVLLHGLDEKHLLMQMDNPAVTSVLSHRGWDGALRPEQGDFLMVVDSNVGFNKTNAVVQASLSYDVDLTDPAAPRSQLVVSHQNNAASVVPCIHYPYEDYTTPGLESFYEKDYPINRCYWDYLRVYTLADAELLGAAVQTVPEEWTMLRRTVPPQVDILDEKIDGIRGFGTFKVVPGGESLATNFRFALPASVLESLPGTGQMAYRLKIQKQPGTQGVVITVRVHLPNGATIQTVPLGAVAQDQNILLQVNLVTDLELEFVFSIP